MGQSTFKNKPLRKFISFLTAFTFLITSLPVQGLEIDPIQSKSVSKNAQDQTPLSVKDIKIPAKFGQIQSKFQGKAGNPIVIQLQDMHCHFEAQSNEARILEDLFKKHEGHGLKVVNVEGASGNVDTSLLTSFPDPAMKKELALYYMRKGKINGAEYLSIVKDQPLNIQGAEEMGLYLQNVHWYDKSLNLRDQSEGMFEKAEKVLKELREKVFNLELKEYSKFREDYEKGGKGLAEYLEYLQKQSKVKKINTDDLKNIGQYIQAEKISKVIDFNQIQKEQAKVMERLLPKMSKEERAEFLTQSLYLRLEKIEPAQFYAYLSSKIEEKKENINTEKNFKNYISYVKLFDAIAKDQLLKEIGQWESRVRESLEKTQEEKEIHQLQEKIEFIETFYRLELRRVDWNLYQEGKKQVDGKKIHESIQALAKKYKIDANGLETLDKVSKDIAQLKKFYEVAEKRDEVMVKNTLNHKSQTTVLLAGGFHTEGMAEKLKQQGISYVIVTPKVTDLKVKTPYRSIMEDERSELENVLLKEIVTHASAPSYQPPVTRNTDVKHTKDVSSKTHSVVAPLSMGQDPGVVRDAGADAELIARKLESLEAASLLDIVVLQFLSVTSNKDWQRLLALWKEKLSKTIASVISKAESQIEVHKPELIGGRYFVEIIVNGERRGLIVQAKDGEPLTLEALSSRLVAAAEFDAQKNAPATGQEGRDPAYEAYLRGKLKTKKVERVQPVQEHSLIKDIRTLSSEDRARYEALGRAHSKEAVAAMMVGGDASRMKVQAMRADPRFKPLFDALPETDREDLSKIIAKAQVPAIVIDGRAYTFLELFLMQVMGERDSGLLPLLMTGPNTDEPARDYLARHGNFGWSPEELRLFTQGGAQAGVPTVADIENSSYAKDAKKARARLEGGESLSDDGRRTLQDTIDQYEQILAYANAHPAETARDPEGKPITYVQNHFDWIADLVRSGTLLDLLEQDRKFVYVMNVDNAVSNIDEDFWVMLGIFVEMNKEHGVESVMEVASRPEGQKGGSLLAQNGTLVGVEDPQLPSDVNSATVPWMNTNTFFQDIPAIARYVGLSEDDVQKLLKLRREGKTKEVQEELAQKAAQAKSKIDPIVSVKVQTYFRNGKTIYVPVVKFEWALIQATAPNSEGKQLKLGAIAVGSVKDYEAEKARLRIEVEARRMTQDGMDRQLDELVKHVRFGPTKTPEDINKNEELYERKLAQRVRELKSLIAQSIRPPSGTSRWAAIIVIVLASIGLFAGFIHFAREHRRQENEAAHRQRSNLERVVADDYFFSRSSSSVAGAGLSQGQKGDDVIVALQRVIDSIRANDPAFYLRITNYGLFPDGVRAGSNEVGVVQIRLSDGTTVFKNLGVDREGGLITSQFWGVILEALEDKGLNLGDAARTQLLQELSVFVGQAPPLFLDEEARLSRLHQVLRNEYPEFYRTIDQIQFIPAANRNDYEVIVSFKDKSDVRVRGQRGEVTEQTFFRLIQRLQDKGLEPRRPSASINYERRLRERVATIRHYSGLLGSRFISVIFALGMLLKSVAAPIGLAGAILMEACGVPPSLLAVDAEVTQTAEGMPTFVTNALSATSATGGSGLVLSVVSPTPVEGRRSGERAIGYTWDLDRNGNTQNMPEYAVMAFPFTAVNAAGRNISNDLMVTGNDVVFWVFLEGINEVLNARGEVMTPGSSEPVNMRVNFNARFDASGQTTTKHFLMRGLRPNSWYRVRLPRNQLVDERGRDLVTAASELTLEEPSNHPSFRARRGRMRVVGIKSTQTANVVSLTVQQDNGTGPAPTQIAGLGNPTRTSSSDVVVTNIDANAEPIRVADGASIQWDWTLNGGEYAAVGQSLEGTAEMTAQNIRRAVTASGGVLRRYVKTDTAQIIYFQITLRDGRIGKFRIELQANTTPNSSNRIEIREEDLRRVFPVPSGQSPVRWEDVRNIGAVAESAGGSSAHGVVYMSKLMVDTTIRVNASADGVDDFYGVESENAFGTVDVSTGRPLVTVEENIVTDRDPHGTEMYTRQVRYSGVSRNRYAAFLTELNAEGKAAFLSDAQWTSGLKDRRGNLSGYTLRAELEIGGMKYQADVEVSNMRGTMWGVPVVNRMELITQLAARMGRSVSEVEGLIRNNPFRLMRVIEGRHITDGSDIVDVGMSGPKRLTISDFYASNTLRGMESASGEIDYYGVRTSGVFSSSAVTVTDSVIDARAEGVMSSGEQYVRRLVATGVTGGLSFGYSEELDDAGKTAFLADSTWVSGINDLTGNLRGYTLQAELEYRDAMGVLRTRQAQIDIPRRVGMNAVGFAPVDRNMLLQRLALATGVDRTTLEGMIRIGVFRLQRKVAGSQLTSGTEVRVALIGAKRLTITDFNASNPLRVTASADGTEDFYGVTTESAFGTTGVVTVAENVVTDREAHGPVMYTRRLRYTGVMGGAFAGFSSELNAAGKTAFLADSTWTSGLRDTRGNLNGYTLKAELVIGTATYQATVEVTNGRATMWGVPVVDRMELINRLAAAMGRTPAEVPALINANTFRLIRVIEGRHITDGSGTVEVALSGPKALTITDFNASNPLRVTASADGTEDFYGVTTESAFGTMGVVTVAENVVTDREAHGTVMYTRRLRYTGVSGGAFAGFSSELSAAGKTAFLSDSTWSSGLRDTRGNLNGYTLKAELVVGGATYQATVEVTNGRATMWGVPVVDRMELINRLAAAMGRPASEVPALINANTFRLIRVIEGRHIPDGSGLVEVALSGPKALTVADLPLASPTFPVTNVVDGPIDFRPGVTVETVGYGGGSGIGSWSTAPLSRSASSVSGVTTSRLVWNASGTVTRGMAGSKMITVYRIPAGAARNFTTGTAVTGQLHIGIGNVTNVARVTYQLQDGSGRIVTGVAPVTVTPGMFGRGEILVSSLPSGFSASNIAQIEVQVGGDQVTSGTSPTVSVALQIDALAIPPIAPALISVAGARSISGSTTSGTATSPTFFSGAYLVAGGLDGATASVTSIGGRAYRFSGMVPLGTSTAVAYLSVYRATPIDATGLSAINFQFVPTLLNGFSVVFQDSRGVYVFRPGTFGSGTWNSSIATSTLMAAGSDRMYQVIQYQVRPSDINPAGGGRFEIDLTGLGPTPIRTGKKEIGEVGYQSEPTGMGRISEGKYTGFQEERLGEAWEAVIAKYPGMRNVETGIGIYSDGDTIARVINPGYIGIDDDLLRNNKRTGRPYSNSVLASVMGHEAIDHGTYGEVLPILWSLDDFSRKTEEERRIFIEEMGSEEGFVKLLVENSERSLDEQFKAVMRFIQTSQSINEQERERVRGVESRKAEVFRALSQITGVSVSAVTSISPRTKGAMALLIAATLTFVGCFGPLREEGVAAETGVDAEAAVSDSGLEEVTDGPPPIPIRGTSPLTGQTSRRQETPATYFPGTSVRITTLGGARARLISEGDHYRVEGQMPVSQDAGISSGAGVYITISMGDMPMDARSLPGDQMNIRFRQTGLRDLFLALEDFERRSKGDSRYYHSTTLPLTEGVWTQELSMGMVRDSGGSGQFRTIQIQIPAQNVLDSGRFSFDLMSLCHVRTQTPDAGVSDAFVDQSASDVRLPVDMPAIPDAMPPADISVVDASAPIEVVSGDIPTVDEGVDAPVSDVAAIDATTTDAGVFTDTTSMDSYSPDVATPIDALRSPDVPVPPDAALDVATDRGPEVRVDVPQDTRVDVAPPAPELIPVTVALRLEGQTVSGLRMPTYFSNSYFTPAGVGGAIVRTSRWIGPNTYRFEGTVVVGDGNSVAYLSALSPTGMDATGLTGDVMNVRFYATFVDSFRAFLRDNRGQVGLFIPGVFGSGAWNFLLYGTNPTTVMGSGWRTAGLSGRFQVIQIQISGADVNPSGGGRFELDINGLVSGGPTPIRTGKIKVGAGYQSEPTGMGRIREGKYTGFQEGRLGAAWAEVIEKYPGMRNVDTGIGIYSDGDTIARVINLGYIGIDDDLLKDNRRTGRPYSNSVIASVMGHEAIDHGTYGEVLPILWSLDDFRRKTAEEKRVFVEEMGEEEGFVKLLVENSERSLDEQFEAVMRFIEASQSINDQERERVRGVESRKEEVFRALSQITGGQAVSAPNLVIDIVAKNLRRPVSQASIGGTWLTLLIGGIGNFFKQISTFKKGSPFKGLQEGLNELQNRLTKTIFKIGRPNLFWRTLGGVSNRVMGVVAILAVFIGVSCGLSHPTAVPRADAGADVTDAAVDVVLPTDVLDAGSPDATPDIISPDMPFPVDRGPDARPDVGIDVPMDARPEDVPVSMDVPRPDADVTPMDIPRVDMPSPDAGPDVVRMDASIDVRDVEDVPPTEVGVDASGEDVPDVMPPAPLLISVAGARSVSGSTRSGPAPSPTFFPGTYLSVGGLDGATASVTSIGGRAYRFSGNVPLGTSTAVAYLSVYRATPIDATGLSAINFQFVPTLLNGFSVVFQDSRGVYIFRPGTFGSGTWNSSIATSTLMAAGSDRMYQVIQYQVRPSDINPAGGGRFEIDLTGLGPTPIRTGKKEIGEAGYQAKPTGMGRISEGKYTGFQEERLGEAWEAVIAKYPGMRNVETGIGIYSDGDTIARVINPGYIGIDDDLLTDNRRTGRPYSKSVIASVMGHEAIDHGTYGEVLPILWSLDDFRRKTEEERRIFIEEMGGEEGFVKLLVENSDRSLDEQFKAVMRFIQTSQSINAQERERVRGVESRKEEVFRALSQITGVSVSEMTSIAPRTKGAMALLIAATLTFVGCFYGDYHQDADASADDSSGVADKAVVLPDITETGMPSDDVPVPLDTPKIPDILPVDDRGMPSVDVPVRPDVPSDTARVDAVTPDVPMGDVVISPDVPVRPDVPSDTARVDAVTPDVPMGDVVISPDVPVRPDVPSDTARVDAVTPDVPPTTEEPLATTGAVLLSGRTSNVAGIPTYFPISTYVSVAGRNGATAVVDWLGTDRYRVRGHVDIRNPNSVAYIIIRPSEPTLLDATRLPRDEMYFSFEATLVNGFAVVMQDDLNRRYVGRTNPFGSGRWGYGVYGNNPTDVPGNGWRMASPPATGRWRQIQIQITPANVNPVGAPPLFMPGDFVIENIAGLVHGPFAVKTGKDGSQKKEIGFGAVVNGVFTPSSSDSPAASYAAAINQMIEDAYPDAEARSKVNISRLSVYDDLDTVARVLSEDNTALDSDLLAENPISRRPKYSPSSRALFFRHEQTEHKSEILPILRSLSDFANMTWDEKVALVREIGLKDELMQFILRTWMLSRDEQIAAVVEFMGTARSRFTGEPLFAASEQEMARAYRASHTNAQISGDLKTLVGEPREVGPVGALVGRIAGKISGFAQPVYANAWTKLLKSYIAQILEDVATDNRALIQEINQAVDGIGRPGMTLNGLNDLIQRVVEVSIAQVETTSGAIEKEARTRLSTDRTRGLLAIFLQMADMRRDRITSPVAIYNFVEGLSEEAMAEQGVRTLESILDGLPQARGAVTVDRALGQSREKMGGLANLINLFNALEELREGKVTEGLQTLQSLIAQAASDADLAKLALQIQSKVLMLDEFGNIQTGEGKSSIDTTGKLKSLVERVGVRTINLASACVSPAKFERLLEALGEDENIKALSKTGSIDIAGFEDGAALRVTKIGDVLQVSVISELARYREVYDQRQDSLREAQQQRSQPFTQIQDQVTLGLNAKVVDGQIKITAEGGDFVTYYRNLMSGADPNKPKNTFLISWVVGEGISAEELQAKEEQILRAIFGAAYDELHPYIAKNVKVVVSAKKVTGQELITKAQDLFYTGHTIRPDTDVAFILSTDELRAGHYEVDVNLRKILLMVDEPLNAKSLAMLARGLTKEGLMTEEIRKLLGELKDPETLAAFNQGQHIPNARSMMEDIQAGMASRHAAERMA